MDLTRFYVWQSTHQHTVQLRAEHSWRWFEDAAMSTSTSLVHSIAFSFVQACRANQISVSSAIRDRSICSSIEYTELVELIISSKWSASILLPIGYLQHSTLLYLIEQTKHRRISIIHSIDVNVHHLHTDRPLYLSLLEQINKQEEERREKKGISVQFHFDLLESICYGF